MSALDAHLRQQLSALLKTGNAYMSFEEVVADFPECKINSRPQHVDYTFWHLIEHVRIAQRDILDYLAKIDYVEPAWPKDYWPPLDAVTDKAGWERSVADFIDDRDQLIAIVEDPNTDLTAPVPSNAEHTVLREIFLVTDHNAYHIGELGILRQVDSAWGKR